jgi:hypothetical protein
MHWPEAFIALFISLGVLGVCCVPVALVLIVTRHRQALIALRHKTGIELAQRGVPLPRELLQDMDASRRYSDLRNGLVLASTGIGVIAFTLTLFGSDAHRFWALGLIPLFAGLGYFATWLLTRPKSSSDGHA